MLIGYDPDTGSVEFALDDPIYLSTVWPNATPPISTFIGSAGEGLESLRWEGKLRGNPRDYRVVDGEPILKPRIDVKAIVHDGILQVEVSITETADGEMIDGAIVDVAPIGKLEVDIQNGVGEGIIPIADASIIEIVPDMRRFRGQRITLYA